MCGNEQVVIFTPTNVQFENVSFFIKVSNEEKFLLVMVKLTVNQRCYVVLLVCLMRIHDNIDLGD